MKKIAVMVTILFFGLLLIVTVGQNGSSGKPTAEKLLPESLDKLYPPEAPVPMFHMAMLQMSESFTAIGVDLFEGDLANVPAQFEGFRTHFQEASKLVPEWTAQFPIAPVDELGAALQSGDQAKVMAALDNVVQVCGNCHHANMPLVQQKYHWGDFGVITMTDPLTKEDLDFKRLMRAVELDYTGIGVALDQGQLENARKHLDGFEARFQTLKESCTACHSTERQYYVDPSIAKMLGDLRLALNETPADPQAVHGLLMTIGQESCMKCHRVHIPAAFARHRMAGD